MTRFSLMLKENFMYVRSLSILYIPGLKNVAAVRASVLPESAAFLHGPNVFNDTCTNNYAQDPLYSQLTQSLAAFDWCCSVVVPKQSGSQTPTL